MAAIPDRVRAAVDELIKQLNANNLLIRQAYIFGSYASGQQSKWSDIDVALVSDRFEGDMFNDYCKMSPYLIKVNPSLEVHPFRPEDFTKDNPFVEEIIETGIRIV
ncbi:MAG: nucleotidyltransferase domain-containing protein [Nitrososphaera sp.]